MARRRKGASERSGVPRYRHPEAEPAQVPRLCARPNDRVPAPARDRVVLDRGTTKRAKLAKPLSSLRVRSHEADPTWGADPISVRASLRSPMSFCSKQVYTLDLSWQKEQSLADK